MAVQIGPHTLTRGELLPAKRKSSTMQSALEAGDGSVRVTGTPLIRRFFTMRLTLPRAEAKRLTDYIENTLRMRAEVVTVVDGFGFSRQMRYWDGDLDWTHRGGAVVDLELVFREEVQL